MRYIYYIIAIVILLSAFTAYQLTSTGPSRENAALIINDRIITTEEFDKLYASAPSNLKADKNEFIDYLITKELMIQEAQKEGIDKDESFRMSMQNFYEQSLIKLLMDRKYRLPDVTVTNDEITRYSSLLNAKLHLTLFSFNNPEEAKKGVAAKTEQRFLNFEDLSDDLKFLVLTSKEGESSKPLRQGDVYISIRIDRIEGVIKPKPDDICTDKAKDFLTEMKKKKLMEESISRQREKASIEIMTDVKK